jgi:NitT/TauT family transport system ATP-binding protein
VVLLTPHPGTVRSIFDIDLPGNRWEYDVRGHESFIESRSTIWSVLKDDVIDVVRREAEEIGE